MTTTRRKLKTRVKFVISLVVMTVICTVVWDKFVMEHLYDCTDENAVGFLTPGDWIHSWGGHPILIVQQVVHGRSLSEPDTIKEGWSVTGLWGLWLSFVAALLLVSMFLARIRWIPRRHTELSP
jgi:hypothetical protein